MTLAPPVRPPSRTPDPEVLIREARRRQRRRQAITGAVAALAAATAAALTIGLGGPPAQPHPTAPRAGATTAFVATPAGWFADAVVTAEGNGQLQVRSAATGKLAYQHSGTSRTAVSALAATGSGRFVVAEPARSGCGLRLYRTQLSAQGQPGPLRPLGSSLPGGSGSLAASAGGQVIGYSVTGCAKGQPGWVGVLDPRTGYARRWSLDGIGLTGGISVSANGHLLAFSGLQAAAGGRPAQQHVWTLPVTAPAGAVPTRAHVALTRPVSAPTLDGADLTANGASFYLCSRAAGQSGGGSLTVGRYRTTTGALQQALATLHGKTLPESCAMTLRASGQALLLPTAVAVRSAPERTRITVAEVATGSGKVTSLVLSTPSSGGMDPVTGLITAW